MLIDFILKIKKQLIECPVIVHLKELNVDKEAREAAEKPAKNLTPHSFPSANPSPYASLSKLYSSSTKSLILLFIGLPSIQIVKTVKHDVQKVKLCLCLWRM